MKRSLLVLSLLLTTLLVQAQMSDIQVMQYVQREMKNGSSQSQIATKLMQKGVTMQQLQRVRSQYEKLNGTSAVRSSGSTTDQLTADSRMRESNGAVRVDAEGNELYVQKIGSSSSFQIIVGGTTNLLHIQFVSLCIDTYGTITLTHTAISRKLVGG